MLKKIFNIVVLVVICSSAFAASMTLDAKAYPTLVLLSWNEVANTVYYDIYKDNEFVARLDSSSREYKVEKLLSNTEYSFSIASRDASNNTLAAAWESSTTDNWDGIYLWENKTDIDNNGKLRRLKLHLATSFDSQYGQYYKIDYEDENGSLIQIFPLFPFDDQSAFEWHKYKEKSVPGNSYRVNAELFNTSSFKPGKWKVYSIVIDSDSTTAYIQTSALGMEFLTTTVFKLYEDESGEKYLSLDTKGEQKIVENYLLKNPNPGEGEAFILKKID